MAVFNLKFRNEAFHFTQKSGTFNLKFRIALFSPVRQSPGYHGTDSLKRLTEESPGLKTNILVNYCKFVSRQTAISVGTLSNTISLQGTAICCESNWNQTCIENGCLP